jgi:hypothetical protein
MLSINKTFVRKITIGSVAYLVEQNKNTQTLSIKHKRSDKLLYLYQGDKVEYDKEFKELIKFIFELAHIDRYILSDI